MKIRGLFYDMARNQRANMVHLRSVIDDLAEFDFNMIILYLEHRFEFPSCPGIAPTSCLTVEMAQNLVEYGKKRGVHVVPAVNLLGHCEGIDATEHYAHLSCDPYRQAPWGGYEQLNLELSESRDLIGRMLTDICEAFPGDYIHIGCDEVRQMHYLFPENSDRQLHALEEYVDFIISMCRSTVPGRQLMVWGDMPLKHRCLMERLPRDLIVCDWNYSPTGSRNTLELYKCKGFRVLSSPAVTTYPTFITDPEWCHANISKMINDAIELDLEGFLLTTWEFGYGTGFGVSWPWIAMASEIAKGRKVETWPRFLSEFSTRRYGVDGEAFTRLHVLLSHEFEKAVQSENAMPPPAGELRTGTIKKNLFRGASPRPEIARQKNIPFGQWQLIWEPSPFHVWLYLRPILTKDTLIKLEAIDSEANVLFDKLTAQCQDRCRSQELYSVLALARAFGVFVDRLHVLESAKKEYHQAALVQGKDAIAFETHMREVINSLEKLYQGIASLKDIVNRIDATNGFDADEMHWLVTHEKSLTNHINALRCTRHDGNPLLEFGEFLRRPTDIMQRITWR